jgi:hypothetical protein
LRPVFKSIRLSFGILAGILLIVLPAVGQIQFGPNLHMTGAGTLSAGYTGDYGAQTPSDHGLNFGGEGSITGYYFAPSFASFTVVPYYNQSRDNSSFQSISNSSGVNSSVSLFSGTRFPASISYAKDFNSTGTYGVPGSPNFTTHGNGQSYQLGWSANLPGLPTFAASFMGSSGSSNVYGTSDQSTNDNHTLSLRSSYKFQGYRLNAYFTQGWSHGVIPAFLVGQNYVSETTFRDEGINAFRALPLKGSLSASFDRSTYDSNYLGTSNTTYTTDTINANATLQPLKKLTVNMTTTFSDNLAGTLDQQIVSAGGLPVLTNLGSSTNSLSTSVGLGYLIGTSVGVSANVSHFVQHYQGNTYTETFASGTIYYSRRLWDMFSFSLSAIDAESDAGNGGLGMQGNVNFSRRFGAWGTDATFSYGQNVQTLLVTYTTSYMNYYGTVRRRLFHSLSWNIGFNGSHSGFSQEVGTSTHSENYFTSLGFRKYSAGGGYSSSSGVSLLGANGLTSTGITPVISPLDQVVYNSTSYNAFVGASPIRNLSVAVSYANSRSNTSGSTLSSLNRTTQSNAQLQYHFRRMGFLAGYTKFSQGISAAGSPAAGVSSYYVGISRWVHFF